jgi:hypothetical protein
VVARQHVEWNGQAVHRIAHQAKLRRRAVVSVVARQDREVNRSGQVPVGVVDQTQKIVVVLRVSARHMQITEMEPCEHR